MDDEKTPPWFKEPTNELDGPIGHYLLGGRSKEERADYGSWCILKHMLVKEPSLDIRDTRGRSAVARELGLSTKALGPFLARLADCGAIERTSLDEGRIVAPAIFDAVMGYRKRCETNRRNKLKGKDEAATNG